VSGLMDYSLCDQTVTLYQKREDGVHRQVLDRAFLVTEHRLAEEVPGDHRRVRFTLIVPDGTLRLRPGDRVYEGEGPVCTDWASFLPGAVPGLMQMEYVIPYRWNGGITHWEAGA